MKGKKSSQKFSGGNEKNPGVQKDRQNPKNSESCMIWKVGQRFCKNTYFSSNYGFFDVSINRFENNLFF